MRKLNAVIGLLFVLAALSLAAFAVSWIQANAAKGLFRGPGDLAASTIPLVLLLASAAWFQFSIGARLWIVGVAAAMALGSLALTWVAHLGGPIYDAAGLAHVLVAVACAVGMYRAWRRKGPPDGAA